MRVVRCGGGVVPTRRRSARGKALAQGQQRMDHYTADELGSYLFETRLKIAGPKTCRRKQRHQGQYQVVLCDVKGGWVVWLGVCGALLWSSWA